MEISIKMNQNAALVGLACVGVLGTIKLAKRFKPFKKD
jgi:hypothetical protein